MQTRVAAGVRTWQWDLWSTRAFVGADLRTALDPARAACAADDAPTLARALLARVERAASRFDPRSDLSRANRSPGTWTEVDPWLVAMVRTAIEGAELTDGLVDPCLGRPLAAVGYDADLGVVRARATRAPRRPTRVAPGAWRRIQWADAALRVPDGVALDLGATGKAWAADLVAETLARQLGCTVVVSLGGDVRVSAASGRARWPVRIGERPGDDRGPLVEVRGGLATSTVTSRRWQTAGGEAHHLLDPRTGRPTDGALRTVSATGRTAVAANVASTAAVVLGAAAPRWLQAHEVAARLVDHAGAVSTVGAWPADEAVTAP